MSISIIKRIFLKIFIIIRDIKARSMYHEIIQSIVRVFGHSNTDSCQSYLDKIRVILNWIFYIQDISKK